MRMGIGLGVGINRSNYAQGIFGAYATRVVADGGVVEAGACVDAVSGLLLSASLLLIPSGYKGGKLYAEIPTNGNGDLTWTRGGDGFRTNASGLIQRVPWNLTSYSEMFSDASWTKTNATISANTTTSPNGTVTADTLIATASTGKHLLQATSHIAGTFTTSIYAKKGTNNFLQIFNGYSGQAYANFDLNNGVLGTIGSVATATIQNIGDGWYRCTLTITSPSPSSFRFTLITSSTAVFDESWTANGTESVFIWGAQLVEGTTAQTYLPTTDRLNFPRLSYMYGSCPAVLAEPQRTNLALRSQEFDDSNWVKIASTITANTTTSPDGTTNADTIFETATTDNHGLYQTASLTNATSYTVSFFVKPNGRNWVSVRFLGINGVFVASNVWFDISNGTIGTTDSGITATIQTSANGFYRITATRTTSATGVGFVGLYLAQSNNSQSYAGSTSNGIFIYGAQLEAGAYPTTYIPTTSATATRVADSFSRSNIYTNGLITASGGTWFVELRGNVSLVRDAGVNFGLGILDNAGTNGINMWNVSTAPTSTRLQIRKNIASGGSATIYTTTTDTCKIAIKWNGTSIDVFENGIKVVSASTFSITNMDFLRCSSEDRPRFIQQMALYPEPKSDQFCIELTTI